MSWKQQLSSKGVRWIAVGWTGFILDNLVLSHNRQDIIKWYGDDNYHMIYNVLSTLACSSIAFGYFRYGKAGGAVIPKRGHLVQLLGFVYQATGFIGMSQLVPALQIPVGIRSTTPEGALGSELPGEVPAPKESKLYIRCPMDFRPKDVPPDGIFGVDRVTRHPALWSMGLASIGTAITTAYVPHAVMFSFPAIFAYIGGAHQDYRNRRGNGGMLTPEREAKTSNVPFAALIGGRQSWGKLRDEIKMTNAALATAAAALLALRRLR